MNPQYYIEITPQKEQEFFDYIKEECKGIIFGLPSTYLEKCTNVYEYVGAKIFTSPMFFITYKHLLNKQKIRNDILHLDVDDYIIIDGLKYSLWEGEMYQAPYIEYANLGYQESGKLRRIYINNSGMFHKSKQQLTPLYEAISKWVKNNAARIVKDGVKTYFIE